ncbi:MAG: V-type ATP synthase subunit K [Candidatus Omnitrophica bacterium]|nr:V-type ATP synthase subunit K [Candidatus Omnitrophota bacterium]
MIEGLGDFNFSLAFSAIGSALGTGIAGMATIGAWKKAFAQNKAAPFALMIFAGAPITQTFYGWLLRDSIRKAAFTADLQSYIFQMIIGLIAGSAIGMSAFMQGKAAARASDALAETGKGFANYLLVIGIIESVALFVYIFAMMALPKA